MKHYYKEVEESELQKCVALSQPLISHLDSEHVKAEWNITMERTGFAIGNLEEGNSIQLKLFDTRRVSWMK